MAFPFSLRTVDALAEDLVPSGDVTVYEFINNPVDACSPQVQIPVNVSPTLEALTRIPENSADVVAFIARFRPQSHCVAPPSAEFAFPGQAHRNKRIPRTDNRYTGKFTR